MKVIARLKLTQGLSTDERNNIEKLTLAALAHLPTAVLYVHDLTGECGTTVSDQVQVCRYEKWLSICPLYVLISCLWCIWSPDPSSEIATNSSLPHWFVHSSRYTSTLKDCFLNVHGWMLSPKPICWKLLQHTSLPWRQRHMCWWVLLVP